MYPVFLVNLSAQEFFSLVKSPYVFLNIFTFLILAEFCTFIHTYLSFAFWIWLIEPTYFS